MKNVVIENVGRLTYTNEHGYEASANFPLLVIQRAWNAGCDFEKEADGFGKGLGTCGGDWSGIRDSSESATAIMFTKALNFAFPPNGICNNCQKQRQGSC